MVTVSKHLQGVAVSTDGAMTEELLILTLIVITNGLNWTISKKYLLSACCSPELHVGTQARGVLSDYNKKCYVQLG